MTGKLGNNIIKLKRKLGIKGVYYEQRRNTKKSREENRHGDELEKAKKENDISDERTKYFGLKGANFIIGVSVSYELYFLEY